VDLTPRTLGEGGVDQGRTDTALRSRRRRISAGIVLVLVLGALGLVLFQGLGNATLYFRNVDEALAQRDELGDRRFRLQGTVVPGSVEETPDGVRFGIEWNDAEAVVVHRGDPPELFQPEIPVVVEGSWTADAFASDRMVVRHTEEYKAENPDRVEPGAP
jgi:cytochrome c-type biogenesis protein CcmE